MVSNFKSEMSKGVLQNPKVVNFDTYFTYWAIELFHLLNLWADVE